MTIREQIEERERVALHPRAALACASLGRERPEAPCPLRTDYQRDRDRILHAKSFRRLKHKTQVFLAPRGDHYRTRLTHTLEVAQIARTIARALRLNEDLAEAVALGHDLGHTPFGHAGEECLARIVPGGFSHVEQSVRVVAALVATHTVSGAAASVAMPVTSSAWPISSRFRCSKALTVACRTSTGSRRDAQALDHVSRPDPDAERMGDAGRSPATNPRLSPGPWPARGPGARDRDL